MSRAQDQELLAQLDALLQQHHERLFRRLHLASRSAGSDIPPQHGGSRWGNARRREASEAPCESDQAPRWSVKTASPLRLPEDRTDHADHAAVNLDHEDASCKTRSDESTFSAAEQLRRALSLRQGSLARIGQARRPSVHDALPSGRPSLAVLPRVAATLVASHAFEVLMSLLIMGNALFSGVEVEFLAQTQTADPPQGFRFLGALFSGAFLAELMLRLLAEGADFFCGQNWRWNFFDLAIVTVSMLELILDVAREETGGDGRHVPSIRVVRMARVVKVLRIARLMRHFRSLRVLVYSVFNTLRSLLWTMLLLGLILFVFGMMFTQATTQHLLESGADDIPGLWQAYGTLGRSVFTLFKAICGGVSWQDIVEPLGELHGVWVLFYLIYFAFVYFAVLNVVTGVFCQTAIESANRDQDVAAQAQLAAKQAAVRQLRALFKAVDCDNNGTITLEEFEEGMRDEGLQAYFASLDISVDEAFSLFKLLDRDENHAIGIDNFVAGCLKLRGPAKCMDIAMMMYETRWSLRKFKQAIRSLEHRVSTVQESCWTPSLEGDGRVASPVDMHPPPARSAAVRQVQV